MLLMAISNVIPEPHQFKGLMVGGLCPCKKKTEELGMEAMRQRCGVRVPVDEPAVAGCDPG